MNRCKKGCYHKAYEDHSWICKGIDFADDNDPGYVCNKWAVLDMTKPTPDWCPVEADEKRRAKYEYDP